MRDYEQYPIKTSKLDLTEFDFISIGKRGAIHKRVIFAEIDTNFFNLALVDVDPVSGETDDLSVSDNGDSVKILATVIAIISEFLGQYPNASIYFSGSTLARTRLYRIGISTNFAYFAEYYLIFGVKNGLESSFQINTDYDAFVVRKK
jgi:hypothetical protein